MLLRRVTAAVLLTLCTNTAFAATLNPRNRQFNNLSADVQAEADASAFNHSLAIKAGQSIGLSSPKGPPGPLLCPTGVCEDDSCCGSNGKCGFEAENCGAGCVSNCNATAMCGRKSAGGNVACGMNLCCSWSGWCGYEDVHCLHADGFGTGAGQGDCQKGMGYCGDPAPRMPKVVNSVASTSASTRKIGYWQSSNVRKRQFRGGQFKCPPVRPGDIPLDGTNIPLGGRWTHLYYAFGAINPTTFHIVDDPSKQALYREFTALKYRPNGPQTWMAVGGFDFSDPGVDPDAETDSDTNISTHSTWSDMAMTAERRAAFIQSTMAFMDKYGFQGIDLDWEYPVAEDRGGRPEDTKNFVALVREMRQAFGTKYGISVALAPDFWYLRYYDAVAMQPYVDWFGFMAYDLHGVWASDSKSKIVRGHTDADEIFRDIIPLAFDGLDFSKINFGMAIYGRGFTLADPKCRTMDGTCSWTGGNEAGLCTDFAGVLSYDEIQKKITDARLQNRPGPTLDRTTMMKYFTWGDKQQYWIGYDDQETWQLKKASLADKYGFGGTMFWSVDFMGQGLDISDVYIDPALVCQDQDTGKTTLNRTAFCHAPCRLIMPECAIPATTVTATYTISIEVYEGPSSTRTETVTTAVTLTTASISFSPVYVGGGRSGGDTFTPVPIIPMPPVVLPVTETPGRVTSRTVSLPNWPTTGEWPPPGGVTNQDPWQQPTDSRATGASTPMVTQPPFAFSPSAPPSQPDTRTTETATTTTAAAVVIAAWPPASIEPTDNDKDNDDVIPCNAWFLKICFSWPGFDFRGFRIPGPLPPGLYVFPPPDPAAIKPPPGLQIDIKPEPHVTLTRGRDNKWTTPKDEQTNTQTQTDRKSCAHSTTVYDTAVSVRAIVTISGQSSWTSTSTVTSTRIPRTGCDVKAAATTAVTTVANDPNCPHIQGTGIEVIPPTTRWVDTGLSPRATSRPGEVRAKRGNEQKKEKERRAKRGEREKEKRAERGQNDLDCQFGQYCIVIPENPFDVGDIDRLLNEYKGRQPPLRYTKIAAPAHRGFTAGYFLEDATRRLENELLALRNGGKIRQFFYQVPTPLRGSGSPGSISGSGRRRSMPKTTKSKSKTRPRNDTTHVSPKTNQTLHHTGRDAKRDASIMAASGSWSASQVSSPIGVAWPDRLSRSGSGSDSDFRFYYHPSGGQGQNIYILEVEGYPWSENPEFDDVRITELGPLLPYGDRAGPHVNNGAYGTPFVDEEEHASQVAAMAVGRQLGVAKRSALYAATAGEGTYTDGNDIEVAFWTLDALAAILESIAARADKGQSSVINLSFTSKRGGWEAYAIIDAMSTAVLYELHKLKAAIVVASGNEFPRDPVQYWPGAVAYPNDIMYSAIPGSPDRDQLRDFANAVMLVGASAKNGLKANFSQYSDFVQIHAPGKSLWRVLEDDVVEVPHIDELGDIDLEQGTSFAAPEVAGLAAYLRGLPNPDLQTRLKEPRNVKTLISKMSRYLSVRQDAPLPPRHESENMWVRTIWNGQLLQDLSCLVPADIAKMTPAQKSICPDVSDDRFWTDPRYYNNGRSLDDNDASVPPIEWQPGEPGPLCSPEKQKATPKGSGRGTLPPGLNGRMNSRSPDSFVIGHGSCGKGCNDDWFCDDSPSGLPPFFRDPQDPNKANPLLGIIPLSITSLPIPLPTSSPDPNPKPPSSPGPSPSKPRQCHFHLKEVFTNSNNKNAQDKKAVQITINSFDPDTGRQNNGDAVWKQALGDSFAWLGANSGLPTDLRVSLQDCLARAADPILGSSDNDGPQLYECKIQFSASGHAWTTTDTDKSKPAYCNVGGYDTSRKSPVNRLMDCFYTC